MKKSIFWILIIFSIVLRIVFSATTYHSDLGAFAISGKFIAGEGKWLTFYDEIASKDQTGKMIVHRNDIVFNYQPLAYILPSLIYLPFSSIVKTTGELFMSREWVSHQNSPFIPLLTMYKLPMLLADIFILLLLPKFFAKEKDKRIAQLLWAFNPIAIFVSSMMGQVDIIIALLILVSLYFARKNNFILASIFVALSALIKPIGLILIPIYAISIYHQNKSILKSIIVAASGIITYCLGVFPFLYSASYRYFALFAEQINKSTYASISIASGHDIPLFFIFYILIVLMYWSKKINLKTTLTTALFSSLAFTHFHPQWLVWIMPLFIIIAVKMNNYLFYLAGILCWSGVLFSFDASLHLQLFIHSSAVLPTILTKSNIYSEMIQISRAGLVAIMSWLVTIRIPKILK